MRPASRSTSSPTSSPTRVVTVAGLRPVSALISARVTVPRAYADRSTMKRLSLRMSLDVLLATTPLPDRARHVMGPGRWSEVCSEWRDHPCSSFEDTVSHGQRFDAQEDLLRGSAEPVRRDPGAARRSEEHTSELQTRGHLVCRPLLAKKNTRARHSPRWESDGY